MDEFPAPRPSSLHRFPLLVALAVCGLLIAAPGAKALGLSGLVATPSDTDAGAHSDFDTHIDVTSPQEQLRSLTVGLPPGLSGNPQSVPKCSVEQLNADECPAASQIGTTSVAITVLSLVPLTVDGSVYNVAPQPGEPARLGIVLRPPDPTALLLPPIVQQVRVELRPDFGLDTILTDLPQEAAVLGLVPVPIAIESIDLDLEGSFMTNPTSCGTKTTAFSARSWDMAADDPPATGEASFESTDCARQPYDPRAGLEIDGNGKPLTFESRPTVTSVITQTDGEANNARASVVLPGSIGVDGLKLEQVCALADFQAGDCAEKYRVGSATAVSPLLDSGLSGPVYGVAGAVLPQIGVDLKGTLPLKILGAAGFRNGRVETTFEGLPDLPLSRFELEFPGGPSGLLRVVGNACGPAATFDADFTSQAGQEVSRTLAPTVKGTCPGPGGGPGDGGGRVKPPRITVKLNGTGRHRPRASIRVGSGGAVMRTVKVTLPRALKLRRGAARYIVARADGRRLPGRRVAAQGRIVRVNRPGTKSFKLVVRPRALSHPARVRTGRKLGFRVRVARPGHASVVRKVRVRARR